jgi:hypothetical protein
MRALCTSLLLGATAFLVAAPLAAQDVAGRVASIVIDPAEPAVDVGQRVPLTITALDAGGQVVEGVEFRVIAQGGLEYDDGALVGTRGGDANLIVTLVVPADFEGAPVMFRTVVPVAWPTVTRVDISTRQNATLYAGTSIRHDADAFHADGSERPDASVTWTSSAPSVASVDAFGNVMAHTPGAVTIYADAEGARGSVSYDIPALPATRLEITGGVASARQGDVITFQADLSGPTGAVTDANVLWATTFVPDDTINAPGASGLVVDGKFVGETPGVYTIVANAGDLVARRTVDIRPRQAVREIEIMGQGSVDDVHTSDLWVYEGVDGRDYAVTGTWGGDGWAKFWDVTDPASISQIAEIQVDARTVNDVKVSPDGRYAALSREGASNRANGPVLVDLSDPMNPTIAGYVEDSRITGGVHNMFAQDDYLFALAGGDKYVIFDVTDIYNPTYVSEYNHPDSRIHDVWVNDGLAYSSEWGTGVVVVDVGNGGWGGSIENPVFVNNVPYPVGSTHAAFPYYQQSTGKTYIFLGDEIMNRRGAAWAGTGLARIPQQGGTPSVTRGYIHIIDFTDPENPKDVARYEVPEFGTHNMWVEDDMLYVAYYEGGVRAVDISGELLGNLATQGREVAVFKAFDPNGYVANAPMAWGPQPHKGNLFFSDFNSGLWSIRISPASRPAM